MLFLRRFINLVLYGHFWIAGAALAMTIQTHLLLIEAWAWSPLDGFIGCGTLTIYALHRLVAMRLSAADEKSSRFQVMNRYHSHIIAYAVLAAALAAYFFFLLPRQVQLCLLIPNAIALGYVLPLLNGRRLRDLPYLKIFLIALAWAWITVIAPAQFLNQPWSTSLVLMALERACFIFAITVPFDIRDLAVDQATAVNTLPGWLGESRAKKIAISALVLMLVMVSLNYIMGFYSVLICLALLLSTLVSAGLIIKAHPGRHDYYFTGLLDGVMILQTLLVILSRFF